MTTLMQDNMNGAMSTTVQHQVSRSRAFGMVTVVIVLAAMATLIYIMFQLSGVTTTESESAPIKLFYDGHITSVRYAVMGAMASTLIALMAIIATVYAMPDTGR